MAPAQRDDDAAVSSRFRMVSVVAVAEAAAQSKIAVRQRAEMLADCSKDLLVPGRYPQPGADVRTTWRGDQEWCGNRSHQRHRSTCSRALLRTYVRNSNLRTRQVGGRCPQIDQPRPAMQDRAGAGARTSDLQYSTEIDRNPRADAAGDVGSCALCLSCRTLPSAC